jgi:hypothetical protein
MDNLTWRDVFDSEKKYYHPNDTIEDCANFVLYHTGYEYFTWDGKVYSCKHVNGWPTDPHTLWMATDIYVVDLV